MLAVAFVTLAQGVSGFQYSGFAVNHVDIGPRFAGTMFGITNTVATISGIIAPSVTAALTEHVRKALQVEEKKLIRKAKLEAGREGGGATTNAVARRGGVRGGWGSAPRNGAVSPQECCWGPAPRPPLGLRPRPRWGLPPPEPLPNGVWGGAPAGVWGRSPLQRSCGEAAPGFGAEPQMIQSSQPVWSRREEPNLSESSLAGGPEG